MREMLEYITFISSIILLLVNLFRFYRNRRIEYLSWLVSSSSFSLLATTLLFLGLDALQLSITPYLGSLSALLLAIGIYSIKELSDL